LTEFNLKIREEDAATSMHAEACRAMNVPREKNAQSKFLVCANKYIINIQCLLASLFGRLPCILPSGICKILISAGLELLGSLQRNRLSFFILLHA